MSAVFCLESIPIDSFDGQGDKVVVGGRYHVISDFAGETWDEGIWEIDSLARLSNGYVAMVVYGIGKDGEHTIHPELGAVTPFNSNASGDGWTRTFALV